MSSFPLRSRHDRRNEHTNGERSTRRTSNLLFVTIVVWMESAQLT